MISQVSTPGSFVIFFSWQCLHAFNSAFQPGGHSIHTPRQWEPLYSLLRGVAMRCFTTTKGKKGVLGLLVFSSGKNLGFTFRSSAQSLSNSGYNPIRIFLRVNPIEDKTSEKANPGLCSLWSAPLQNSMIVLSALWSAWWLSRISVAPWHSQVMYRQVMIIKLQVCNT